jgi:hypothetical protein
MAGEVTELTTKNSILAFEAFAKTEETISRNIQKIKC